MLSKEQGILFLPFLAVLETLPLLTNHPKRNVKRTVLVVVFISVSTAVLAYARLYLNNFKSPSFQAGDNPAAAADSRLVRGASYAHVYTLNALLLAWPAWLCFDWALGCVPLVESVTDMRLVAILAFLALLTLLVSRGLQELTRKGNPFLLMSLAVMITPFLLCLNLAVRVGFVVAERNLYLCVLGYSMVYHYGLVKLVVLADSKSTRGQLTRQNLWRGKFWPKLVFILNLFCLLTFSKFCFRNQTISKS